MMSTEVRIEINYPEWDKMSLLELGNLKQKMSNRCSALNRAIQKRKEAIKAAARPGEPVNSKSDPELIKLKIELTEASNDICNIKEYMQIRKSRAKIEEKIVEKQAELETYKIELEKAKYEAENKDFVDGRNAKANERRPGGPPVWFGREFDNIKGSEKRLIVMMAREIGQARYQELKRIAYWDEQHRNNRYYTGNDKWSDRKGLF